MADSPADKVPEPGEATFDLEALLRGDETAFEQLVRNESTRLYKVIVRIVRDEDEAKSVMQETFLQAYRRLHTFRGESKFTTWLYAIGINLGRAARRKSNRFSTLDEADIDRLQPQFSRGMFQSQSDKWNPHTALERSELRQMVTKAIDRLPDDYRIIVTLRDIREMPTHEVALLLHISEGAARVRLHRARRALKKLLDPFMV